MGFWDLFRFPNLRAIFFEHRARPRAKAAAALGLGASGRVRAREDCLLAGIGLYRKQWATGNFSRNVSKPRGEIARSHFEVTA